VDSYYDVLGVPPEASLKEVKSAFRRQAKRLHPDLQARKTDRGAGARSADAAMRLLLEAYRALLDPEKRRAYDRGLRRRAAEEGGFDYRRFLKERPGDPESQAKLVVYDLLHGLEDEAIEIYERSKSFEDFRLERYLERSEAMDAEFCVAEEYEKRERWIKAYAIYRRLVAMEAEKPCFKYFFEVVALRFRSLVLLKLPKVLEDEDYVDALEEAASMALPRRDLAQILRKKAEVQLRIGEAGAALESLERASRLEPRLAGLVALRRRAGGLAYRAPLA
jgi:curved DNA-binding protein CbpA